MMKPNIHPEYRTVDVEFSQRGTLALLAAIGDAPINAWMSD